jgi:hypothetical protein
MSKDKNEFQEKIGVGERQYIYGRHAGSTRDIIIKRDDNGKIGGKQTEHWNGSVDCTVFAETQKFVMSKKTGDIEPK